MNIKPIRLKIFLFTMGGIFSFMSFTFGFIINEIEQTAKQAAVLVSAKHMKDTLRLKAKHKKDLAKVKLKQRSKAKIQRVVAAIPIIGLASLIVFEKMEFDEWKIDHPGGTIEEYSEEITQTVNQLLVDEYKEYGNYYDDYFKLKQQYIN